MSRERNGWRLDVTDFGHIFVNTTENVVVDKHVTRVFNNIDVYVFSRFGIPLRHNIARVTYQ